MPNSKLTPLASTFVATLTYAGLAHADPIPALQCDDLAFPGGAAACRDYLGDDWTPELASADCSAIPGASGGTLVVGSNCTTDGLVGVCTVDGGTTTETRLYFYGGDVAALENACVGFLQGEWSLELPAGICEHQAIAGPPGTPLLSACKQYSGSGWDLAGLQSDCATLSGGVATAEALCPDSDIGYCTFAPGTPGEFSLHYYEGDGATLEAGCQQFGGSWTAAPVDEPVLPEALAALVSDDDVIVDPEGCDAQCLADLTAARAGIVFAPADGSASEGLIIYPGGGVDPRAYAVAARAIAQAGYLVVIVPFPGNVAIGDPMRANSIILAHPEIDTWGIAGHSLGGVTASIYAAADPFGVVESLTMWAAFAPEGVVLTDAHGVRVYSITADLDGLLDMAEYDAARVRLPESTYHGVIVGGNHANFGYYGEQEGDLEAAIPRDHQHELFVAATLHNLNLNGTAPGEVVIDPIFDEPQPFADLVCRVGQLVVGNFRPSQLRLGQVEETFQTYQSAFTSDHPEFPAEGARVRVIGHAHQVGNADDAWAPPIYDGELWCKMKSQEAIAAQYGLTPRGEPGSCADLNELVFYSSLLQISPQTIGEFLASGVEVEFTADRPTASGPEFLGADVISTESAPCSFDVQAPTLRTPLVVPAPFGGVHYCKVWSPTEAVRFIEAAARGVCI